MFMKRINGFDEKQVFEMYNYLLAYEDCGIIKYKSTKALLLDHPELSELETVTGIIKCRKSNAYEMKGIDFKSLKNEIYFTKKYNNLLSLLNHLRNSIAHCGVVEHNGSVLITDYANPRFLPVDFTARGCIELNTIKTITMILKKVKL